MMIMLAELIKRIGDWDGIEGALETNSYPLFIPKVPNSILGKELRSDKFSGFLNPEFRKKNFVHTVYLNSRVRVNLGWAIQLKYGSQATHRKKNNESALIEALRNLEDWQVFGIDESKKILPTYNSLHFGTIFVMPTQIVELLGEYIYLLKDFMEFDNTETKSWF